MSPETTRFLLNVISIVLIDVLLAGDNAIVIAMAVKMLPAAQRRQGVAAGAGGAVILRVVLTFFAWRLLHLEFVELAGGILIFWIALKLLISGSAEPELEHTAKTLRQAIWMIVVADFTMSLDNILPVAALAKDNLWLLIAGLGLSISFVVFMSSLLVRIMDRYPILVWIGGAILGRVAGGLIVTDPWVIARFTPPASAGLVAEIGGAVLVPLVGWVARRSRKLGLMVL
jgi:YjbE family integral membrane protein